MTILFVVSMALYPLLGTQLFPETDAGTFTINFRAPAGTRLNSRPQMARQIERIIRQVIPPGDLDTVVSNIGLAPSLSAIYSSNSSEDSGFIQVELKNGHTSSNRILCAAAEGGAAAKDYPKLARSFRQGASSTRC